MDRLSREKQFICRWIQNIARESQEEGTTLKDGVDL
jgi:hypothetical protein